MTAPAPRSLSRSESLLGVGWALFKTSVLGPPLEGLRGSGFGDRGQRGWAVRQQNRESRGNSGPAGRPSQTQVWATELSKREVGQRQRAGGGPALRQEEGQRGRLFLLEGFAERGCRCSGAQSCPTLCDPMDTRVLCLPLSLESAQTHVH